MTDQPPHKTGYQPGDHQAMLVDVLRAHGVEHARAERMVSYVVAEARTARTTPRAGILDRVTEATAQHGLDMDRRDADGNNPCTCGVWTDDWDRHWAEIALTVLVPHLRDLREALDSLEKLIVTSSKDWGGEREGAWLYGVLVGWDCYDDHEHDDQCGGDAAMLEMAKDYQWPPGDIDRIRRYQAAVANLETP